MKRHSFAYVSTRRHYWGRHSITLIANGVERGILDFELRGQRVGGSGQCEREKKKLYCVQQASFWGRKWCGISLHISRCFIGFLFAVPDWLKRYRLIVELGNTSL